MSNLIASNYRATSTGFLPSLQSNEAIETLTTSLTVSPALTSVKGGLTTVASTGTAAGVTPVTFNPAAIPPIGAIKEFIQMSTTATNVCAITPNPTTVVFIKGSSTSVATVTLDVVLSQFARFQYVGVNGSGKLVYRLVSTNGTVV